MSKPIKISGGGASTLGCAIWLVPIIISGPLIAVLALRVGSWGLLS